MFISFVLLFLTMILYLYAYCAEVTTPSIAATVSSCVVLQLSEVERKASNYSFLASGVCFIQVSITDCHIRSLHDCINAANGIDIVSSHSMSKITPMRLLHLYVCQPSQIGLLIMQLNYYRSQAASTKISILCISAQVNTLLHLAALSRLNLIFLACLSESLLPLALTRTISPLYSAVDAGRCALYSPSGTVCQSPSSESSFAIVVVLLQHCCCCCTAAALLLLLLLYCF
jgi:hypothetical protein